MIRYDSTHGVCKHSAELAIDGNDLVYRGRRIKLFSERDPSNIDWKQAGAEYVIEATGKMTTVESARKHIQSGARKVIISAPSKDAKTIVVGVNRKEYSTDMDVVSNASCTVSPMTHFAQIVARERKLTMPLLQTNCLAPLAKVLHRSFGIDYGMMTTVHASTSSQHVLDSYSRKNRRLGRAVASNIIPSTTVSGSR